MFRSERGLCPRNRILGGGSKGDLTRSSSRVGRAAARLELRPPPSVLGGEVDEGEAAEGAEDLALHALDGGSRASLKAQGEIGIGVGGAHESPAVGEEDASAIDVDGLVAPLELPGEL